MFTLQQIAGSAEFMNHLATRQEQRQSTGVLQPEITTVSDCTHQWEKCHFIVQYFEKVGHVQRHLTAKSGGHLCRRCSKHVSLCCFRSKVTMEKFFFAFTCHQQSKCCLHNVKALKQWHHLHAVPEEIGSHCTFLSASLCKIDRENGRLIYRTKDVSASWQ